MEELEILNKKILHSVTPEEKSHNTYKRSTYYYGKKEYSKAIDDCNKAIEQGCDTTVAISNILIGVCYEETKNYNKAIEYYSKSIERGSENCHLIEARGVLYGIIGEKQKAKEDIETAEYFVCNNELKIRSPKSFFKWREHYRELKNKYC